MLRVLLLVLAAWVLLALLIGPLIGRLIHGPRNKTTERRKTK